MIYIFITLFFISLSATPIISRYRYVYLAPLILLAFISFNRGDVGTDTSAYDLIFYNLFSGHNDSSIQDPLFLLYAKLLSILNFTPEFATRFLSILIFILFFSYLSKSNERELIFLACILCAGFSINFSMNILRAGAACLFFLVYTQSKSKISMTLFFLLAISSQISIIISFLFFWLFKYEVNFKKIILISILIILLFIYKFDFLLGKFLLYSNYNSPSNFSGLTRLPLFLILCFMSRRLKNKKFMLFTIFSMLSCLYLIQYSYAFLRIIDLILISAYATYIQLANKENIKIRQEERILFILSGIMIAFASLRNILDPSSNFTPYVFI